MTTTNEKLKAISNDLKGFLLIDGRALPSGDYNKVRHALDCVDFVRAAVRSREIQTAREMERAALAMATPEPEPEPEPEPVSTFGVKGCPE